MPTVKAIIDGIGPAREFARTGHRHRSPGYGLIPDDSDQHVRGVSKELLPTASGPWVDLLITEVTDAGHTSNNCAPSHEGATGHV